MLEGITNIPQAISEYFGLVFMMRTKVLFLYIILHLGFLVLIWVMIRKKRVSLIIVTLFTGSLVSWWNTLLFLDWYDLFVLHKPL